jgi:hypothetical protein
MKDGPVSNDVPRKLAVTIPEAVALSGIGRSSLYKLFSEGMLTPRKSGKRTLILVSDLEAFVGALPAAKWAPHNRSRG